MDNCQRAELLPYDTATYLTTLGTMQRRYLMTTSRLNLCLFIVRVNLAYAIGLSSWVHTLFPAVLVYDLPIRVYEAPQILDPRYSDLDYSRIALCPRIEDAIFRDIRRIWERIYEQR